MRIVLDSKARLPKISKLAQTARILPTFLVTTLAMPSYLAACGIKSIVVAQRHQKVDLALAMEALVNIGVERLFVEGGAQIATAFLKAGYVDRVEWFRAPTVMGGDSKPAIGYLNLADLSQALRFMRLSVQSVGDDLWETYEIMGDD
jgi:diaminohydroxyphosphoribosylaminopyrimidine deaminase/5-amino-6-(5-phosphoribosylamino)uracil reductase